MTRSASPKSWITGGRGFIGRHMAASMHAKGHAVIGLGHGAFSDAERTAGGWLDWRNGEVSHANLDGLAAAHGLPDTVLHLAGGSAVGPSFALPAEDFRRTVISAADLAEWVRLRSPLTRLVMASSAAVYGAGHPGPIIETAACRPFSPYGYHKRMAESVLESYARNFGLSVAIVRFFSVYGAGLRKQLLWDCCTRLVNKPLSLNLGGNGTELRDWVHVADAVALLACASSVASPDCPVLNGGSGTATSIQSVAESLCAAWQLPGLPVRFSGNARPGDPASLVADPKAAMSIGWQPTVPWAQGIAEYVNWYRAAAQGAAL